MRKTNISSRRWLLLPVETKARELHAKVLLACVAAEKGWGVVLGEATDIREKQDRLPKGIILEKSIHPGTEKLIERSLVCGNRVSAWCEEGLIYYSKDDYKERRLKLESFDQLDLFFAWGNNQAMDIYSSLNRSIDKIVLAGNPRFDLLRPEIRGIFFMNAMKIRSRYGPIILVNTKFPMVNFNIKGVNRIEQMKSSGIIKTTEGVALMYRAFDFQKKIFLSFLNLIPVLSKSFPNYTIVIRPHPSECHTPWIELSQQFPNVKVIFEGNADEWIIASDVTIQNNCTTGVEAFLLDKPSISYRPYTDNAVEHPLPDQVNYSVSNEDELKTIISKIFSNKKIPFDYEKRRIYAKNYISNIDGKLASDIILENLDRLDIKPGEISFPITTSFGDFKKIMIDLIKPNQYALQKFPGLEFVELKEILNDFQAVTGRFNNVRIAHVDNKNCYCFFSS